MKNWQFFGIVSVLMVINTNIAKGFHMPAEDCVTSFIVVLVCMFIAVRGYFSDNSRDK